MLLQTNSYIVPKEKRAEHARLMRRFRQILNHIGCDSFEVYEQVGNNWGNGSATGRFVQIMRFRDRKHQLAVQAAERTDPTAQELIAEFCELVNYPYQQQNGLFAIGFYTSVLPVAPARVSTPVEESQEAPQQFDVPSAGAAAGAAGGFAGAEAQEQPAEQEQSAFEQMALDEEIPAPEQSPDDERVDAGEQDVEEQAIAEPELEAPAEEPQAEEFVSAEPEAIDEEEGSGFVLETEQPQARAEPSAPVQAASNEDDWSIMDEARAIDDSDEESIGIELHSEPSNGHGTPPAPAPAAAKRPVSEEPVPEIDLGPDDEEEDDLVDMADRFIEDDESSKKPTPPRRR